MERSFRIAYGGSTPAADSATYKLLDTTVTSQPGQMDRQTLDAIRQGEVKRYLLSLKTSHIGTLRGYGSADAGGSWHQFYNRVILPTEAARMRDVNVRIDQHADFKFDWINGGSAQSTWYVAQALTSDVASPVDHGYDDPAYVVNQTMAHTTDFRAPAIQVGPEGKVRMNIQWASTSSPVGTFSLQFLRDDGTTWNDVPGASTEFTNPASNSGNIVCYWRELRPFKRVALRYVSTSGGAVNALQAQFSTW